MPFEKLNLIFDWKKIASQTINKFTSSKKLIFLIFVVGDVTNFVTSVSPMDTHHYHHSKLSDTHLPTHGKCEPITIEQCKNLEYNETIMPNVLNQMKQSDAKESITQYSRLIQSRCSQYIQIFLCSVFVPVCTQLETALPPCRSLCLNSKLDCESVMKAAGYGWPEELDCKKFPDDNVNVLCVSVNGSEKDSSKEGRKNKNWPNKGSRGGNDGARQGPKELYCPTFMRADSKSDYRLFIGDSVMKSCGMPCGVKGDMFSLSDKRKLVRLIICIVACICLLSSLFTFLTFLVDTRRFRYPERPIVFISACYCVIAIAYIVAYALDNKISCSEFVEHFDDDISFQSELITQGTKREGCTIIFVMLYFSTLASCIWWVILTLTWFLSAGLKWGQEAVESRSQYFHLLAWAVPGVMTIVLLAMGQVDGDALTGICNTGLTNKEIATAFVAGPLIILLSVGIFFLLAGFISLCRVRNAMKFDGNRTDKLEKLMVRIGVYALLYVVPVAFVVGCVFYEHAWRTEWVKGWYHQTCSDLLMSGEGHFGNVFELDFEPNYLRSNVILQQQQWACGNYPSHFANYAGSKPDLTIFVLKHLMTLIVGVACGFWVCSGKTAESWSKFFCRSNEASKKNHQKGQPTLL
ncbi:hypothetical protein HELRODRAFT_191092 [Helobdella robusta]|uniref:Uncharacterized protein n=1 Tax=Helobdella robusta TaxID=6412 RepID=T1FSL1_HELRO|nr:hypothetical protein HELRODRAFT_191092 [Helobdella robusta]ESO07207.1 hypothetical protein HELRODRAFT_191092 [Helobdella robusta]